MIDTSKNEEVSRDTYFFNCEEMAEYPDAFLALEPTRWVLPATFMQYDPLLKGLAHTPGKATQYQVRGSSTERSWRTAVRTPALHMWNNFELFSRVLFGGDIKKARGNWKPFTRLSRFGISLSDATRVKYSLADLDFVYRSSNPGYELSETYFWQSQTHSDTNWVTIEWDSLHSLASQLLSFVNSDGKLVARGDRRPTYDKLGWSVITNLTVTADTISYDADYRMSGSVSNSIYHQCSARVEIFRPRNDETFIPFTFDISEWTFDLLNVIGQKTTYNTRHLIECFQTFGKTIGDSDHEINKISYDLDHSIVAASPALYFTQANAVNRLLGDISANFESLVESPAILYAIITIYDRIVDAPLPDYYWKNPKYAKGKKKLLTVEEALKKYPSVGKMEKLISLAGVIMKILRLLAGGYLTYIFAASPTITSALDAINRAKVLPSKKYESTVKLTSEDYAFTDLDPDMATYILSNTGYTASDVSEFKIIFHSEIQGELTTAYIMSVIESPILLLMQSAGAYPSLVYAYNAQPFTWVLETILPLAKVSQALEDTVRAPRSQITSLGHSIYVRMRMKDGYGADIYIRSDNTTTMLYPSSNLWLEPGDISRVAVPVALIALLGIGGK